MRYIPFSILSPSPLPLYSPSGSRDSPLSMLLFDSWYIHTITQSTCILSLINWANGSSCTTANNSHVDSDNYWRAGASQPSRVNRPIFLYIYHHPAYVYNVCVRHNTTSTGMYTSKLAKQTATKSANALQKGTTLNEKRVQQLAVGCTCSRTNASL